MRRRRANEVTVFDHPRVVRDQSCQCSGPGDLVHSANITGPGREGGLQLSDASGSEVEETWQVSEVQDGSCSANRAGLSQYTKGTRVTKSLFDLYVLFVPFRGDVFRCGTGSTWSSDTRRKTWQSALKLNQRSQPRYEIGFGNANALQYSREIRRSSTQLRVTVSGKAESDDESKRYDPIR